ATGATLERGEECFSRLARSNAARCHPSSRARHVGAATGTGDHVGTIPARPDRMLFRYTYCGGRAVATWVYHTSSGARDPLPLAVSILQALLDSSARPT